MHADAQTASGGPVHYFITKLHIPYTENDIDLWTQFLLYYSAPNTKTRTEIDSVSIVLHFSQISVKPNTPTKAVTHRTVSSTEPCLGWKSFLVTLCIQLPLTLKLVSIYTLLIFIIICWNRRILRLYGSWDSKIIWIINRLF